MRKKLLLTALIALAIGFAIPATAHAKTPCTSTTQKPAVATTTEAKKPCSTTTSTSTAPTTVVKSATRAVTNVVAATTTTSRPSQKKPEDDSIARQTGSDTLGRAATKADIGQPLVIQKAAQSAPTELARTGLPLGKIFAYGVILISIGGLLIWAHYLYRLVTEGKTVKTDDEEWLANFLASNRGKS